MFPGGGLFPNRSFFGGSGFKSSSQLTQKSTQRSEQSRMDSNSPERSAGFGSNSNGEDDNRMEDNSVEQYECKVVGCDLKWNSAVKLAMHERVHWPYYDCVICKREGKDDKYYRFPKKTDAGAHLTVIHKITKDFWKDYISKGYMREDQKLEEAKPHPHLYFSQSSSMFSSQGSGSEQGFSSNNSTSGIGTFSDSSSANFGTRPPSTSSRFQDFSQPNVNRRISFNPQTSSTPTSTQGGFRSVPFITATSQSPIPNRSGYAANGNATGNHQGQQPIRPTRWNSFSGSTATMNAFHSPQSQQVPPPFNNAMPPPPASQAYGVQTTRKELLQKEIALLKEKIELTNGKLDLENQRGVTLQQTKQMLESKREKAREDLENRKAEQETVSEKILETERTLRKKLEEIFSLEAKRKMYHELSQLDIQGKLQYYENKIAELIAKDFQLDAKFLDLKRKLEEAKSELESSKKHVDKANERYQRRMNDNDKLGKKLSRHRRMRISSTTTNSSNVDNSPSQDNYNSSSQSSLRRTTSSEHNNAGTSNSADQFPPSSQS